MQNTMGVLGIDVVVIAHSIPDRATERFSSLLRDSTRQGDGCDSPWLGDKYSRALTVALALVQNELRNHGALAAASLPQDTRGSVATDTGHDFMSKVIDWKKCSAILLKLAVDIFGVTAFSPAPIAKMHIIGPCVPTCLGDTAGRAKWQPRYCVT